MLLHTDEQTQNVDRGPTSSNHVNGLPSMTSKKLCLRNTDIAVCVNKKGVYQSSISPAG